LEQVAVQLLDVVFGECYLCPGSEDQLHSFSIAGDFLLVSGREGFDLQIEKQRLHFTVGQFVAFNAGR
jgi:hypothetical protein